MVTVDKFHKLELSEEVKIPTQFTFPFYYKPHPLVLEAAKRVEAYLENDEHFNHDFFKEDAGKMIGVLIVENAQGELGFLAGYSGVLGGVLDGPFFVPAIYNRMDREGFFKKGEKLLNEWNDTIAQLEEKIRELQPRVKEEIHQLDKELEALRLEKKQKKADRKDARLFDPDNEELMAKLALESQHDHFHLKDVKRICDEQKAALLEPLKALESQTEELKKKRKQKSNKVQKQLFSSYLMYNANGEKKSVVDLFEDVPPAGTGDCAAPKMLNYAFQNGLKPIAMGEYWRGNSPKKEVRKNGHYYPACKTKCEPLLEFMLQGLDVEENPMDNLFSDPQELKIVFEDEDIIIVDKPANMLSVPGRTISDCVSNRVKEMRPNLTGPVIVHRLDFSTSGLLLFAKNKKAHKHLQMQFINKTIRKRYLALLDGVPAQERGEIDLPLCLDWDNRPQQMVCHENGSPAQTHYRVLESKDNKALVYFYPITGRTHQLRVHAAHASGLNCPIVGDDLYGIAGERLHLQALSIDFIHPRSKKKKAFKLEPDFGLD